MAEILIAARNTTNADPDMDRRGCYKRGDPVVVMPDGHTWGRKEGLPRFVVVKIPGVSVAQVEAIVQPQTEDDAGSPVEGTFRRRRWRVLVDTLPAAIKQTLAQTGEITVTPAQVRNYVRRVRDNLQFGDL